MTITVSDILEAVRAFGEPEIDALLAGLGPVLGTVAAASVDGLLRLGEDIDRAVEAKNRLAAMRDAVKAADDASDAAEAAVLAGQATGGQG